MNSESNLSLVNVVLGAVGLTGPVLFGFILWKLSRIFATREELTEFKTEIRKQIDDMEEQIVRLRIMTGGNQSDKK